MAKMSAIEMGVAERAAFDPRHTADYVTPEESVLALSANANEQMTARWDEVIDEKLIEWGRRSSEFELDGFVGPSNAAIRGAYEVIKYMRKSRWPLPTGVIADGEGGIVFESRHDPTYERIEVDERGNICFVKFYDCKLVERVPIDLK